MHSVLTLQESGQGGIREVVLHLEQVNQLRHPSALLHNRVEVLVRVSYELLNRIVVSKDTVLFGEFEHSKVRLTRHQQPFLYDVDQTEAEEVQWNVHEVRCGAGHEPEDVVS